MPQSPWFRKLPGDRPLLGIAAGATFFVIASLFRWLFGGMSEGFGPMTFLPAILLAVPVRRHPHRPGGGGTVGRLTFPA